MTRAAAGPPGGSRLLCEKVEASDPGVVEDVDTPEDYARLFGIDPSR